MKPVLAAVCLAALATLVHVVCGAGSVSDDEIKQLSEKLFSSDNKELNKLVKIDLQGKTYSSATDDKASRPLLHVNDDAIKSASRNVGLLAHLYDNYIPDCTKAEKETDETKKEQSDLLDGFMATPVLNATLNFLSEKGLAPSGKSAQKQFLQKLWFSRYSRCGGALGSSAFEHVFLGELKKHEVSGMHSWLFFHQEEKAKNADYKGHIKTLSLNENGVLIKARFTWHGANKPVNSMLIGTSPELEMSLYTLCFLARPDKMCSLSAHGVSFEIQTWRFKLRDGFSTIGSAYPCL